MEHHWDDIVFTNRNQKMKMQLQNQLISVVWITFKILYRFILIEIDAILVRCPFERER